MKFNHFFVSMAVATGCFACASGGNLDERDQLPMYGAVGEQAEAEMVSKNKRSLKNTAESSENLSNQGFGLYQQNDLQDAMRQFNKAWLSNPQNPESYWGFSLVLTERNKFCDALVMVKTAQSKGAHGATFLTDAALIYTGCALEQKMGDAVLRDEYLAQSDTLFVQALGDSADHKEYVLFHWARALYKRGDYAGAWGKVKEYRVETGKDVDQRFLRTLSKKMLEPR